jgi:competence protein ComEA
MLLKNLKVLVKDFLLFSKGERNGIIVILLLILLTASFRIIYPKLNNNKNIALTKAGCLFVNDSLLIRDSIRLNYNKPSYSNNKEKKTKVKEYTIVELNTADSAQLINLPGIGSILSGRIIKYRNLLGGYYKKDQLAEVFGLKEEHLMRFIKYIVVDTAHIKKVSLNYDNFADINRHPYISYSQTKAIFKIRNQNIKITKELIVQNKIFDSTELIKLTPYINFVD